jgi:hypothetical protein
MRPAHRVELPIRDSPPCRADRHEPPELADRVRLLAERLGRARLRPGVTGRLEATALIAGRVARGVPRLTRWGPALNFATRYNQTGDVWTQVSQAARNAFTPAGTEDLVVVEFDTRALSDGYRYVSATIATAGTLLWYLHDLEVARKPTLLRSVSA